MGSFGGIRTETTNRFGTWRAFSEVISRHNPGAGDGIFAEFHALGKHWDGTCVNSHSRLQPTALESEDLL